jgi:hypothetical protein
MKRLTAVFVLAILLVGVVAAGDGEKGRAADHSRYELTILRQDVTAGDSGARFTLEDFGSPEKAVVPRAGNLRTAGFLGAIPWTPKIMQVLLARKDCHVLWRGEVEGVPGRKLSWVASTELPVVVTSRRGDQETVSMTYKQVGAKLELEPSGGDVLHLNVQFSAATYIGRDLGAVISQISSQGVVGLPDGYTAVFCHLDRIPVGFLNQPSTLAKPRSYVPTEDDVSRFYVLLTRMDLERAE